MARRAPLRAVAADEKVVPMTVLEAGETGSRLDELVAMRRRIARALDDPQTAAKDLSPLSRRQLEIGREIDAIRSSEDEDHSVVVSADDEPWNGTGF